MVVQRSGEIGETGMPVEAHLVWGEAAAPSPAAIRGPLLLQSAVLFSPAVIGLLGDPGLFAGAVIGLLGDPGLFAGLADALMVG
jgi:hypothetical protein